MIFTPFFLKHFAPCPYIETNKNIILTRGGNSFLTWMKKILLKPMLMTSCGMSSKRNYHCWCKCFPRILFLPHHPLIELYFGWRLLIAWRAVIYHCTLSFLTACLYSKHTASWDVMSFFLLVFFVFFFDWAHIRVGKGPNESLRVHLKGRKRYKHSVLCLML